MANKKDMKKYDIELKQRSVPKDEKHFFNYSELAKKMWSDIIKKGHEAFNISFDHENDESTKERRILTLEIPDEYNKDTGKKKYQFRCDLHMAGGDWQEPSCYFRCQLVDGSLYGVTRYPGSIRSYGDNFFIVIPGPQDGNTRLDEGKDGGFVAIDSTSSKEKAPKLDTERAWEYLGEYLTDLLLEELKKKELNEMLEENKDPGRMNKAASVLDAIADRLEARGLFKEATHIDVISNTLEKLSAYNSFQGGAATKQMDYQERSFMQKEAPGLMEAARGIKEGQQNIVLNSLKKQYGPQIGQKLFDTAEAYAWDRGPAMSLAKKWTQQKEQAKLQAQSVPAEKAQDPSLPYGQKKRPVNLPSDEIFLTPMNKAAAALESRGLHELSTKLKELGQHIVKYLKTMENDVVKEVTKKVKKKK
ncbi:MAG: hypothetical protein GF334_02595 [Candidatus Altiarchaeales archaeon]|nr:hypothetical protein [Candidatus Altiarchaeales archaeon]